MAFLILVIGDMHIPDRALDIPPKFKKLLAPGKIGQTLCLGNLTDKHTYDYLRSVAPDLKIVKGRYDVEATSLPLTQVVTHGGIRIGFLEGFTLVSSEPDLLLAEANRLDVDVLCWGGTHRFDAFEYMDKFFVNPGSATGAFVNGWAAQDGEDPTPSFCLMDVRFAPGAAPRRTAAPLYIIPRPRWGRDGAEGDKGREPADAVPQVQGISLTLYVYQLRTDDKGNENVAVEKVTYTKPVEPTPGPSSS
ncbi:Vacuolar protein sorting-associated protein 29 [Purpureocillium takamizusanense]|uniref:Vacuolar protein sorting-associated protein 29 n=1 Tax=Purpureocillium takamizusanense TaxID=2060973 RepID=A0A9Q8QS57_9HYPO|nr:Vacuolar protein sorting-associated protein 29 [Purpureocillium takamizusanense]UNI24795.1 Vacuolar protein sorting-associated protein 29 [Purpureocillium takamizusanense]